MRVLASPETAVNQRQVGDRVGRLYLVVAVVLGTDPQDKGL